MTHDNAVAVAIVAADSLIDKLELETSIPKSDRDFLAAYQAKVSGGTSSSKDEDRRMIKIFEVWALQRHRITG